MWNSSDLDTDEIVTECILVSPIREVSGVSFERGLHCIQAMYLYVVSAQLSACHKCAYSITLKHFCLQGWHIYQPILWRTVLDMMSLDSQSIHYLHVNLSHILLAYTCGFLKGCESVIPKCQSLSIIRVCIYLS